jgi:hypothetical protein
MFGVILHLPDQREAQARVSTSGLTTLIGDPAA